MLADLLFGLGQLFLDPVAIALFFAALIGGMVFGAIPGVNALTLAAILIPFSAQLSPTLAIMVFSVIYVSGVYGGAVTAILFNIPGSPENAPTCFDGYPMTRKGLAGKAIGAAVICSAIGGTASAIVMIVATPGIASWAVRAFGPPEIFAFIMFGLSVAATVGAKTLTKGWLSIIAGLLIATVGADPAEGVPRFSFGSYYLMAGIGYVPLILGFFAITEVFVQSRKLTTGIHVPSKVGVNFPKLIELWRIKLAVVRSAVIGFLCGVLPGVGAVLAAFVSYNEAVRWSRHPQEFGTGKLEGVVASETANNAATGAAMIPLLALGLPGGALTAMMLGVLQLHGITPGPLLFLTNKDLVWVTFAAMLAANLCILVLGYLETRTVVHLLRIPFRYIGPWILLISTVGAYALRNLVLDVWVMYLAGIAGYFMRRGGYSIPGLILGVILGRLGESAFVKTMQMFQYDAWGFLERPIAATLIALAVLTAVVGALKFRPTTSPSADADHAS